MTRARSLILVAALGVGAMLSACATPPPTLTVSASAAADVSGAATIAQFGTWEHVIAPEVTRLTVLARTAIRLREQGRISHATASSALAALFRAEAELQASRRGQAAEPTAEQRAHLAEARRQLDLAAHLLEP